MDIIRYALLNLKYMLLIIIAAIVNVFKIGDYKENLLNDLLLYMCKFMEDTRKKGLLSVHVKLMKKLYGHTEEMYIRN